MSQSDQTHNFVSDPDLVAAFLEALMDGFKKRRLSVRFDDREIVLKPAEILDLSLETTKRKGRQRLTLTIAWPEPDRKEPANTLFPKHPGGALERGGRS